MRSRTRLSRRQFLTGVGVAVSGTVLQACASSPAPTAAPPSASKAEPVGQATTGPTAPASAKPAAEAPKPAAPGAQPTTPPAVTKPARPLVKITFNTVKKQDVSDWIEKGLEQDIDGWKARNIEVKVEAVPGDYAAFVPKVMAMASGGQLGDAIWYVARHRTNVGWGVRYNVVRDINPLAQAANYDMKQFYPGSVEGNSFQGKTYWICYIGEPVVPIIAYNKSKALSMGLAEPQDDWTYDDLAGWARAATKDGTFGYYRADAGNSLQGNGPYFRQWGVQITDELGKKATLLDNKEGFVGALKFRYDLMNTWKVSPSPAAGSIDVPALFGGQKVLAVNVVPPSIQSFPATFKDFEIGFVFPPVVKKGDKRRSMLNQHTLGVTTASKQPEAAFEFVTWASGKEMVVQGLVQGQRATSARADVWADERIYAKYPTYRKLKPIMDTVEADYNVGNFRGDDVDLAFAQAYDLMELGKVQPEQTATDAQKLVQAVLDRDPP
jgi:ABC-type glycerol-3-phosphate transport system substrate-binding protein